MLRFRLRTLLIAPRRQPTIKTWLLFVVVFGLALVSIKRQATAPLLPGEIQFYATGVLLRVTGSLAVSLVADRVGRAGFVWAITNVAVVFLVAYLCESLSVKVMFLIIDPIALTLSAWTQSRSHAEFASLSLIAGFVWGLVSMLLAKSCGLKEPVT
jgi:hypothetical protein